MKSWRLWLLLAGASLAAIPAGAMTVTEVIDLSRAGASDAVIMAQIEVDGTVFKLTVEDILQLKEAGVSDAVITYVINTGKNGGSEEVFQEEASEAETEPAIQEESYHTDVDSEYQGSFGLSIGLGYHGFGVGFGYYYPWPGYAWNCFYDPYWWPWYPYYYSAAPYYYDYYGYCSYPAPYSCHNYYPGYDYGYNDGYYYRDYKGRYIGDRGGATSGGRIVKDGYAGASDALNPMRGKVGLPVEQADVVPAKRTKAPSGSKGTVQSKPANTPVERVGKPATNRSVAPKPANSGVQSAKPGSRSVKPKPASTSASRVGKAAVSRPGKTSVSQSGKPGRSVSAAPARSSYQRAGGSHGSFRAPSSSSYGRSGYSSRGYSGSSSRGGGWGGGGMRGGASGGGGGRGRKG